MTPSGAFKRIEQNYPVVQLVQIPESAHEQRHATQEAATFYNVAFDRVFGKVSEYLKDVAESGDM
ncbi:hypothetical protein [Aminobacter sp. LjRoot7]|uniref:hypothetical protein n=1 Tax=Aminobacter sp. LjRoot7 TaxID=3342335 RepID=UPI003ECF1037